MNYNMQLFNQSCLGAGMRGHALGIEQVRSTISMLHMAVRSLLGRNVSTRMSEGCTEFDVVPEARFGQCIQISSCLRGESGLGRLMGCVEI